MSLLMASQLTIDSLYDTKELLGQGTFSKVKRAIERSTGEQFAIKIIGIHYSLLAGVCIFTIPLTYLCTLQINRIWLKTVKAY